VLRDGQCIEKRPWTASGGQNKVFDTFVRCVVNWGCKLKGSY